ncbi:PAP2 superfamily protein [Verrucomicrobiia bacterium DG1235]|nr:PAP2 superfamily protein [Verrucomicrobiae bacterium DG1235]
MQNLSTCLEIRKASGAQRDQLTCKQSSEQAGKVELWTCGLAPIVLSVLAIGAQYSTADVWVASLFYDANTAEWPFRENGFVKGVLHDAAQDTVKIFGAFLLLFIASKFLLSKGKSFPKPLGIAFLALLAGPLLIGYLKSVTHLACPWDESLFGGAVAHLRLFDNVPQGTPIGHGFPSAHASSGYTFVSLYFAAAVFAPAYRFKALGLGLLLGLVFGIAQQARGAHFLSHDLFALSICWSSAGSVYFIFYRKELLQFFGYKPS